MTRLATTFAGILLLLAGGAAGWSAHRMFGSAAKGDHDEVGDEAGPPSPSEMEVMVVTCPAALGDLPLTLSTVGVVEPDPAAVRTLSTRAGGRVLAVAIADGQVVHKDDRILDLDPAPLQAAVAEARGKLEQASGELTEFDGYGRERQRIELRAAVDRATADAKLADTQVSRLDSLRGDGLVSEKGIAEARQAAERAHSDLKLAQHALAAYDSTGASLKRSMLASAKTAAEARVREADADLAATEVHAPADGQVLRVTARPGDKLEPGASFGSLLTGDGRLVEFGVPPGRATGIPIGTAATWGDALGQLRSGKVARTVPTVSSASGLVEVIVIPDPGTPPSPPGLIVRGEIEVGRLRGVMLVPAQAIVRSEDRQVLVVAGTDHAARIVPVKVLGRSGDFAAVEGGLKAGERVIVEGGYNLPAGAHVVETQPSPNHAAGDDGK